MSTGMRLVRLRDSPSRDELRGSVVMMGEVSEGTTGVFGVKRGDDFSTCFVALLGEGLGVSTDDFSIDFEDFLGEDLLPEYAGISKPERGDLPDLRGDFSACFDALPGEGVSKGNLDSPCFVAVRGNHLNGFGEASTCFMVL